FLGWMFSGVQLTLMNLASGAATTEFARAGTLDDDPGLSLRPLSPTYTHPSVSPLAPDDVKDLAKRQTPRWYARFNSAFLMGAACGGLIFGWIGEPLRRVKAMGLSIVWYSLFAGVTYGVTTPEQLLL